MIRDRVEMPRTYWDAIADARVVLQGLADFDKAEKLIDRPIDDVAEDLTQLLWDARPAVDPAEHDPSFRGGALGEESETLFAIGEVDLDRLVDIAEAVWGGSLLLEETCDLTREDVRAKLATGELNLVHDWFIMRTGIPGDEYTFWIERAKEGDPHAFRGTWLELV